MNLLITFSAYKLFCGFSTSPTLLTVSRMNSLLPFKSNFSYPNNVANLLDTRIYSELNDWFALLVDLRPILFRIEVFRWRRRHSRRKNFFHLNLKLRREAKKKCFIGDNIFPMKRVGFLFFFEDDLTRCWFGYAARNKLVWRFYRVPSLVSFAGWRGVQNVVEF